MPYLQKEANYFVDHFSSQLIHVMTFMICRFSVAKKFIFCDPKIIFGRRNFSFFSR